MQVNNVYACTIISRSYFFRFTFYVNILNLFTSKLSDPTTKKFSVTNPVFGGNRVGECFDCYNGTITWTSNVIRGEGGVPSQLPLHMGVFPMERYVSHCNFADVQGS